MKYPSGSDTGREDLILCAKTVLLTGALRKPFSLKVSVPTYPNHCGIIPHWCQKFETYSILLGNQNNCSFLYCFYFVPVRGYKIRAHFKCTSLKLQLIRHVRVCRHLFLHPAHSNFSPNTFAVQQLRFLL